MDKVTVVGGSGFIGSHVADKLRDRGFRVTIFDQKPSVWKTEDQEMLICSILYQDLIDNAIEGARYVYHFAGIADIAEARLDPFQTLNLNVMGTTNLLQASAKFNVERFIFASSIYVYSPYGSFYTASKQSSEIIIDAFQKEKGLDYSLLRYGSLYGPRAQEWNGINKFISQIVKEGRLDYFGTGEEKREYIHVEDAAQLSLDVLDKEYINSAVTITGTQIYNSKELIDMIFEISNRKSNVSFNETDDSNAHYIKTPYRYIPKHSRKLVPKSFIDIGQGILETVRDIAEDSQVQ